tara:strand:+ start:329 stop:937 length:609 start_codon:yes stop_codon:yes gene_type:complete
VETMNPSPETLLLFPGVLHTTRFREAAVLNASVAAEVEALRREFDGTPPKEFGCTMYSTMVSAPELHLRPGLENLVEFVAEEVGSFADVLDYETGNGGITKCWLNVLGSGDSCDLHNDTNSVVSGVYFVNSVSGGARLQFHAPSADEMIVIQKSQVTDLNVTEIFFDGEAGDLLLFPSYLMRSWTLNQSAEEQVMLLFTAIP